MLVCIDKPKIRAVNATLRIGTGDDIDWTLVDLERGTMRVSSGSDQGHERVREVAIHENQVRHLIISK